MKPWRVSWTVRLMNFSPALEALPLEMPSPRERSVGQDPACVETRSVLELMTSKPQYQV